MRAMTFPAYIITASWEILDCNAAFRVVWGIGENEVPFNAVERLFLNPGARAMHGERFTANLAPVIAMVRSAVGRRPHVETLQRLREQFVAEHETRALWDAYEISDPLVPNACTIESPIGTFRYEALTLANPVKLAGSSCRFPTLRAGSCWRVP